MLAIDARIDNRFELALGLGWTDRELDHHGDSALIEALWQRHGARTFDRLVGDFAIAVFDVAQRALFLARDPTGQRPLHYRLDRDRAAFASMPRPLALGRDRAALSAQRVADYLLHVPDCATGSFFAGVESVPPGSLVRIDGNGARVERWWNPSLEPLRLSIDEAVEEASHLLGSAVRAQLRSSRQRIGAELSGGLDSGAVVAFAAEALAGSDQRLVAYTATPFGPREGETPARFLDEDRRAAEVAALYPHIEHRLIAPEPRDLFADLGEWHRLFDRPIGNYCNNLWDDAIYQAAAKAGADVMLIGLAGNFSFSFDGTLFFPELIRSGRWGRWLRLAWLRHRHHHWSSWRTVAAQSFGPFLPGWLWSMAKLLRRNRASPPIDELNFLRRDHPLAIEALRRADAAGADVNAQGEASSTGFRLRAIVESDPGNLNHAYRTRWGIETRDPTADRRLVEFCLRLPHQHYFDGRTTRLLARRMLKGRMPDESRLEERSGYQGADWRCSVELSRPAMRRELKAIASDAELSHLFDHEAMTKSIDNWPANGWDDPFQIYEYRTKLMRTLTAAHWLRTGG